MNATLLEVYTAMERGEISIDQAQDILGVTDLRIRMRQWGLRLPLLLATLDKLRSRQISREEAAEALNLGVREINYLMSSWKVQRDLPAYLVSREASQVKWEVRKKHAIDFIGSAGSGEDLTEAAEGAGCSVRQMRRWVSELLERHVSMQWKDLQAMDARKRRRLAVGIEKDEQLDYARQQAIRAISEGKKAIPEVALDRVLAKRVVGDRRAAHV